MTTPVLEVKNLVKRYKSLTAVDGVSFAISPGTCFGLLGPNGAGKTTALEVIEDIIDADSGEVFYNGTPKSVSFREEIGIQFQHTALLNFLTVRETLETFQSLYHQSENIDTLVDLCGLQEILANYNNKISGGQAQRLMLALALINKPKLVFLDEPSTGLDPQARHNLWDVVVKIKEQGKTIILTTHSMDEAEFLCDEIAIMDHGKIIAQGSPTELIETYCEGATISLPAASVTMPFSALPFPHHQINGRLELSVDNIKNGLEKLLALKVDITEMVVHSPDLEDVFLNLTGRKLRE